MNSDNQRLIVFSDSVIAITIALMALEIRLPEMSQPWTDASLWQALADLMPQIRAYILSFVVVGIFWLGHRSKFIYIQRHSMPLVWLNLMFLLEIGFMPFVTDVLAQSGGVVATILYAATTAVISLTSGAMTLYADKAGLTDSAATGATRVIWPILMPALVFCSSIPIALVSAHLAQLWWLLLIPAGFVAGRISPR